MSDPGKDLENFLETEGQRAMQEVRLREQIARLAREHAWSFYQSNGNSIPNSLGDVLRKHRDLVEPIFQAVFAMSFINELSEIWRGKKNPDPEVRP